DGLSPPLAPGDQRRQSARRTQPISARLGALDRLPALRRPLRPAAPDRGTEQGAALLHAERVRQRLDRLLRSAGSAVYFARWRAARGHGLPDASLPGRSPAVGNDGPAPAPPG